MSADSYTVAEAAKVLQRSAKRVRQMLQEGKLTALPDTEPVRIGAQQVHELREALRDKPKRERREPAGTGLTAEQVAAMVEELTRPTLRALEANKELAEKVEGMLREELAAERAERQRLQDELDALRAQPAEAERRKFLGLF